MNKTTFLKLLGLFFGIVLLFLFLRNIDFQQVGVYLRKVGWKFLILLVITGGGYALATWAWFFSFREIKITNAFRKLFVYRLIGETLAVINPTGVIAGDAAKIYFLKKEGISLEEANSSTLISRVLVMVSLICLLILSSFFFFDSIHFLENDISKFAVLVFLSLAAFGFFWVFVSEKMYLYKITRSVFNLFTKSSENRTKNLYNINIAIIDYYKNFKTKFAISFFLSTLHWLAGALEFFVILHLLGIDISFWGATMLEMGVILVKSLGTFIPGQIGVEEQANKMMLVIIGVSIPGIWIAVSVFRRARQIFWLATGSLLYLLMYKKM